MITPTKKDLLTGEEFTPKRRNQLFVSRENQIRYNNMLAQQKRDAKRQIDSALDKNRNILSRLLGQSKSVTFSRDYLLGAGYEMTAFTQTAKNGEVSYYCIYEFALIPQAGNQFKIMKR